MCHTYEIRYIYVRTSYAEHTHVIRMKYTCVIHMTYGVHKSIRDSYDRTFVIRMKCVIQMLTRHTQDIHTSYAGHTHVIRRTYTRHTYEIYMCHTYDIRMTYPLVEAVLLCSVHSDICTSVFPLTYVQVCSLLHMYKCVPSYICTSVFPPTHV